MKGENAMSEALLLVAEGYEQIAAGIRKMVAAQKDTPKKDEKPVKMRNCRNCMRKRRCSNGRTCKVLPIVR